MPTLPQILLYGLGAIGALALVVTIRELVRAPFSPMQNLLWWTARFITRFWWKTELPAKLPIPESGAVLMCNHRSSVDPIFLQVMCRRVIHWMVAREFCEHKKFAWFLKILEVIPVRRSGVDTASTKAAIRLVQSGGLLGIFPEGRINKTDELMLPARPGAVLIAVKARAPLIPCYIKGSPYGGSTLSPLRMPAKVKLHVGEPIRLDEYFDRQLSQKDLREIMTRCLQAIADLAGDAEFEPKLAGRKWLPDDEVVPLKDDEEIKQS